MYDVRQKIVTHPSSFLPETGDAGKTEPLQYTLRLCRAAFLVALGISIHLMVPAGAPLPVPTIAPNTVLPLGLLHEPSIMVERSMVFAPRMAEVAPRTSPPLSPSLRFASNDAAPRLSDTQLVVVPDLPAFSMTAASDGPHMPVSSIPLQSAVDSWSALPIANVPAAPVVAVADAVVVKAPDTAEAAGPLDRPVATAAVLRRTEDSARDLVPVAPRSVGREARLSSNGAISEEEMVQRLLEDFTGAYGRLDVRATKAVWPTVNGKALQRAFDQLSAQRLTLQSCGITISGSTANARCRGSATYQPRIGTRSVQVASREWTFDLSKQDTAWRIVNTFVR